MKYSVSIFRSIIINFMELSEIANCIGSSHMQMISFRWVSFRERVRHQHICWLLLFNALSTLMSSFHPYKAHLKKRSVFSSILNIIGEGDPCLTLKHTTIFCVIVRHYGVFIYAAIPPWRKVVTDNWIYWENWRLTCAQINMFWTLT